MLKKYAVMLLFAVAVACGSVGSVYAQDADAVAAAMAMLNNEPPLTQADIDAYLKMAPEVNKVMGDMNATMKLYQDNNISPQRFAIVGGKIAMGISMAQGLTREQLTASGQVPEFMLPNDAEAALIQKNMSAIMGAMGVAQ